MKKLRAFDTEDPRVGFVSTEEAEGYDMLICMPWTSPPLLSDNQRGRCAVCKCVVQHRPDVPRKPMRVCVDCAPSQIRPQ